VRLGSDRPQLDEPPLSPCRQLVPLEFKPHARSPQLPPVATPDLPSSAAGARRPTSSRAYPAFSVTLSGATVGQAYANRRVT
jgi:hypothetical protein